MKCIEEYVTLFSLKVMIVAEEIIGFVDFSCPILPSGEIGMSLVVGHWAEVMLLRLWQVVVEITAKMHRESKNVAGLVYLEEFIIIVFLGFIFMGLSIKAFFRCFRRSRCFSLMLFLYSLSCIMLFM